jgi:energy-coupling factor transporter ATP-binding protein EcfA2
MTNTSTSHTIDAAPYKLNNLNKINIVLGKNGCGKSTMLRKAETVATSQTNEYGKTKYISPERGGALIYSSNVLPTINNGCLMTEGVTKWRTLDSKA